MSLPSTEVSFLVAGTYSIWGSNSTAVRSPGRFSRGRRAREPPSTVVAVASPRQLVGEEDGDRRHRDDEERGDVGHRPVARLGQLVEDPDRQRPLLAGGEGGDDHLVEREREGEHSTGQESRPRGREGDPAESVERVRAEVHRGLDLGPAGPAQARRDVVVDRDDAEGRVAGHDRPEAEGQVEERQPGAERDAGDDPGESDRQEDEERDRLPPEEPAADDGESGQRAEEDRHRGRDRGDPEREPERLPEVGPPPGDAEPLERQPRRREAERRLVGREGVESDDEERQVEERDRRAGRELEPERRPLGRISLHRRPREGGGLPPPWGRIEEGAWDQIAWDQIASKAPSRRATVR